MVQYKFYVIGPIERPVKLIIDSGKSFTVLAYNWRTGFLEEDDRVLASIYSPLNDAEQITEDEFNAYVEDLRACLTMETPVYYVWAGNPRLAERDEKGQLRVWGFNHRTGEMDYDGTVYDIVSRTVSQTTLRTSKDVYDRCVAEMQAKWRERQKANNS